MTPEEKRTYLKAHGWRREDRAIYTNVSVEWWVKPGTNCYGHNHLGVTLRTAYDRCRKENKQK